MYWHNIFVFWVASITIALSKTSTIDSKKLPNVQINRAPTSDRRWRKELKKMLRKRGDRDTGGTRIGKNFAVLVAGSNGWMNYRHQADICHAYHILNTIGKIPAKNIYVLMADDIAYNQANPIPGNIINYPNGPNVYPGVVKDFVGKEVTASTFLSVLKELPSTADDNVFLYFADHGAQGLLAMPFGPPVYADELMTTIKRMHENEQYNQMVIYVEACESGSMFDGILPDDINIYATTASNDNSSSYAWFYDETRGVYLADMYSIMWMQDSQNNMTSGETLLTQFDLIRHEVNESQVEEFGDLSIQNEPVMNFQASRGGRRITDYASIVKEKSPVSEKSPMTISAEIVSSRDIVLSTLMKRKEVLSRKYGKMEGLEKIIDSRLKYRDEVDDRFERIVWEVVSGVNKWPVQDIHLSYWMGYQLTTITYFDCLRELYPAYHHNCGLGFEDYSLKYVRVLAALCEVYEAPEVIRSVIHHVCAVPM